MPTNNAMGSAMEKMKRPAVCSVRENNVNGTRRNRIHCGNASSTAVPPVSASPRQRRRSTDPGTTSAASSAPPSATGNARATI